MITLTRVLLIISFILSGISLTLGIRVNMETRKLMNTRRSKREIVNRYFELTEERKKRFADLNRNEDEW